MSPVAHLDTIKQVFDKRFASWGVSLPAEYLIERRRASVVSGGWTINFRFDAAEGLEYIEYFASHRMTNDTLRRIYADGREELIDYCQEFFEADNEQAEQAYLEHNRKFYEEVKCRGLW